MRTNHLFLAVTLVLMSCQVPQSLTNHGAALQVQIGTVAARTVAADPAAVAIDSYRITLTSRNGFAPLVVTQAETLVTFAEVDRGTWDIEVDALHSGTVVAHGNAADIVLSEGPTVAVSISLSFTRTAAGAGGYSLNLVWPSDLGVDTVVSTLVDGSGKPQGPPQTWAAVMDGSSARLTVQGASIPSGTYLLKLDFRRGGARGPSEGLFTEAVNIWDNVVSNQWVDPSDGHLVTQRTLVSTDFLSSDCHVSMLSLSHDGDTAIISPGFSSLGTAYHLSPSDGASVHFFLRAEGSVAGQALEWGLGDQPVWSVLTSGTSQTIDLSPGQTVVHLRVTAPDHQSKLDYSVSVSWTVAPPPSPVTGLRAIPGDGAVRFMWDLPAAGTTLATTASGGALWMTDTDHSVVAPAVGQGVGTTLHVKVVHDSGGQTSLPVDASGTTVQAIGISAIRTAGDGRTSSSTYDSGLFPAPSGGLISRWWLTGGTWDFGGLPLTLSKSESRTVLVSQDSAGVGRWLLTSSPSLSFWAALTTTEGGAVVSGWAADHAGWAGGDLGPGTGNFVARINSQGQLLWAVRTAGSVVVQTQVGAQADIVVSGTVPAGATEVLGLPVTSESVSRWFVAKLGADGQALALTVGNVDDRVDIWGLVAMDDGSYVVSVTNEIRSLTSDGTIQWSVPTTATSAVLAPTASGDVLVNYSFTNSQSQRQETFVGRLDAAGHWKWTRSGPYLLGIVGTLEAADRSIYLYGMAYGDYSSFAFALDNAVAHAATGTGGALLAKVSADGEGLWAVTNTLHPELKSYRNLVQASDGSLWAAGTLADAGGEAPVWVQYKP